MFVHVVKRAPRFVVSLLFAVILTLLAFAVAVASFLGVTMALQGWATHPLTSINAPAEH